MSTPNASVAQRAAEHLRGIRLAAGVTQDDLAAMMNARGFKWTQSTVTKTEGARRPLLLDEYVAMCEALEQSPGTTLTIVRGPQIPKAVRVAEVRARIAAKHRELDEARDALDHRYFEIQQLQDKLTQLEADDS